MVIREVNSRTGTRSQLWRLRLAMQNNTPSRLPSTKAERLSSRVIFSPSRISW